MSNILPRLTTVLLLLPLLTACQWMHDDYDDILQPPTPTDQYLNITISVAGSTQSAATRAPLGGENGDGREAGFARENAITGITLILADGPISSSTSKVAFCRYFPVTATTSELPTNTHNHTAADIEQQYTTGNQRVEKTDLDLAANKTYYIYVVANRFISLDKGDNLQTAVSNLTLSRGELFTGDAYTPDGCQNFVMTSEQDVTVNFGSGNGVSTTADANAVYFNVTNPIIIERLAARIDFCTNYVGGNASYDTGKGGFKYQTGATGTDASYFILESITPFNLYNEQQYLFERVQDNWTPTPTITYLGQEQATNFVVDPHTAEKTAASLAYTNPLGATVPDWTGNVWLRTAASLNSQTSKTTVTTTDDSYVVAYAMENTLMPTSPLKTYATGLAITGSYYDGSDVFQERKIYYGYLRHQGETASANYRAYLWEDLPDAPATGAPAMNYGVVRNNIYRVAIESISATGGWLQLRMAVHDWRNVEHPSIYI